MPLVPPRPWPIFFPETLSVNLLGRERGGGGSAVILRHCMSPVCHPPLSACLLRTAAERGCALALEGVQDMLLLSDPALQELKEPMNVSYRYLMSSVRHNLV